MSAIKFNVPEINGNEKVTLGIRKSDGRIIHISKPSFDCGWYWGFGYLGNRDEHYHLSGFANGRNINMYDALKADYSLNPKIENNLWEFCELVTTAYALKTTAEVLGRGGSHYCTNPLADLIINKDEVKRINEKLLPAIFNALNEIYSAE